MNSDLLTLKKQIRILGFITLLCLASIIVLFYYSLEDTEPNFEVIRARGIVIEDSIGRDRILIGAPIPSSAHRVRTDTTLVRKYWAKNYKNQDQFMKWYSNYRHSAIGMVVLNEDGFDRVQIGDKLSDPNSGKRMFESAGITWNDQEGWEKGGAGVNTSKDGSSRSVMGVDDSSGEAVHIAALEDGTKGLFIGGENGQILIGMAKKESEWFQNKEKFAGIKYFSPERILLWEQEMSNKEKK